MDLVKEKGRDVRKRESNSLIKSSTGFGYTRKARKK